MITTALFFIILYSVPAFVAYVGFEQPSQLRRPIAAEGAVFFLTILALATPIHIVASALVFYFFEGCDSPTCPGGAVVLDRIWSVAQAGDLSLCALKSAAGYLVVKTT